MVIGLGYWGPNLVRALSKVRGAELYGVSDLSDENLEKVACLYPGLRLTKDYKSMAPVVDAVFVATPPATHFQIASYLLSIGKHVYIEKPITPGVDEAIKLGEIAKLNSRCLMVGHIYEYAPIVERAAEIVSEGRLGNILHISSVRANLGRFSATANVVWDLLPHDLSIVNRIPAGDVAAVSCTGIDNITPGVADIAYITCRLDNGIVVHIENSWLSPKRQRAFTIVGDQAMLVIDETQGARLTLYHRSVRNINSKFDYIDDGEEEIGFSKDEPLVLECQHFIDSAIAGTLPRTNCSSNIKILKVIEAAQRSISLNGEWIKLES